jgi:SpoU rRNA methylase family enzyme
MEHDLEIFVVVLNDLSHSLAIIEMEVHLLKQSKVDASKQITKRMRNSIHKYGVIIYSNGWDNVARHT